MAKIYQLAEQDRPREKMMERGEQSLTNAELFAILIGSGNASQSAVELMQEILDRCGGDGGSLAMLERMPVQELMAFRGIGEAKALSIKAAAEIARRRAMEDSSRIQKISNSEEAYKVMYPHMRDLGYEEFWALLLDNSQRLLRKVRLSQGGLSCTAVDVRMLMKEALMAGAIQMIVCHNHPSGSLRPSREDLQLTLSIQQAASTLKIRLIDHLIITDGNYYSFQCEGKL